MSVLSRLLSQLSLWFAAFGIVAMTGIICWQVFARYVLGDTPPWAEQLALFLMLWFILFAAAAGVREGFHINLSLLQESLPKHLQKIVRLVNHGVILVFGLFMAAGGGQLVQETWQHAIPALGLSRGLAYLPVALSGALISFFSLEHMIAELQGRKVVPLWS
jgi:TRAP-type C4-dicarboxylate transport system permease small subunit